MGVNKKMQCRVPPIYNHAHLPKNLCGSNLKNPTSRSNKLSNRETDCLCAGVRLGAGVLGRAGTRETSLCVPQCPLCLMNCERQNRRPSSIV
jgi:hypothetical protein